MNLDTCQHLDAQDPLASLRNAFALPEGLIYLDGNSLGPLLHRVRERVQHTIDAQWGQDLITSWNQHNWINLPTTVGEKIARLLGAGPGQVICADSVSINLFKVLAAATSLRPERSVILTTTDNFPTDLYMAQGLSSLIDGRYQVHSVPRDELLNNLSTSTGVVMLTEVDFRTGQRFSMAEMNAAIHGAGALAVWDLSHSAGAVPVRLDASNTDFAVGCGYKFLNGGPGAPAYVYVAERHQHAQQPLRGWMGHAQPFEFSADYQPMPGIRRYSSGTPGIVGLAALDAAMDIWADVEVMAVQRKSMSLAEVVRQCLVSEPALAPLQLTGPGPGPDGGSQLSLRHEHAYEIVQALIERGVVGDFRSPDIIRLGLCPLFLSHAELHRAMSILGDVLRSKSYTDKRFTERAFVT